MSQDDRPLRLLYASAKTAGADCGAFAGGGPDAATTKIVNV
jgi:hypothetical protein